MAAMPAVLRQLLLVLVDIGLERFHPPLIIAQLGFICLDLRFAGVIMPVGLQVLLILLDLVMDLLLFLPVLPYILLLVLDSGVLAGRCAALCNGRRTEHKRCGQQKTRWIMHRCRSPGWFHHPFKVGTRIVKKSCVGTQDSRSMPRVGDIAASNLASNSL